MKPSATFWNRIAKRYAKSPVGDEAAYRKKLEITRGYLTPGAEMLDFGCGTGSTSVIHAPYVSNILAVDISKKMLAIAKDKAAVAGITNITFKESSIDELTRPDQPFDVVLGMSILHLLEDKEAVIAKVYDLLKPGGVFISSTVCIGGGNWFLKLILPIGRPLGLLPLVQFFTPEELQTSITDAGFEIDHEWQPGEGKAVFLVAKKPG